MKVRTWLVAGSVAAALSGTPALPQEIDVEAQREQLLNKLDELQNQIQPPGQVRVGGSGAWTVVKGAGPTRAGGPVNIDIQRYTDVYREMAEVRKQIVRLDLGPELAVRYDRYLGRQAEYSDQYRELLSDKEMDNETRRARTAEIREAQMALRSEYADVLKKSSEAEQRINLRRMERSQLDRLKDLLKPSDSEWQVLEPRLRQILRLQHEVRLATRVVPFLTLSTYRWQHPPISTTEGQLIALVKKDDAEAKAIQEKLDALRRERAETQKRIDNLTTTLRAARQDLRKLLILRQESILVIEGLLD